MLLDAINRLSNRIVNMHKTAKPLTPFPKGIPEHERKIMREIWELGYQKGCMDTLRVLDTEVKKMVKKFA